MRPAPDNKSIIASLIGILRAVNNEDNFKILNTSEVHFDWAFPSAYSNTSIPGMESLKYNKTLTRELLASKDYLDLYLRITEQYFKLIELYFNHPQPINFEIQNSKYLIRLAKIVQSYQIFHDLIEELESKGELDGRLNQEYDLIKSRYKKIVIFFNSISQDKRSTHFPYHGGYSLHCLQDCFRRVKLNSRGEYSDYIFYPAINGEVDFTEGEKFIIINDIPRSGGLRSGDVRFRVDLADQPLPYPAGLTSNQRLIDRAKGAIYGQAIADAMGLSTEFMSRHLAKYFLHHAGVIKLYVNGIYKVEDQHLVSFLRQGYKIRERENYLKISDVENKNGEFFTATNHSGVGLGDSRTNDGWRQLNPHGSFTDDTDQAVLKFYALRNSGGDINLAVKLYAAYVKAWAGGKQRDFFGKENFGLGSNTGDVIKDTGFLEDPHQTSKLKWQNNPQFIIPQANGALMSSSYILQFYPDDLDLALKATEELAKVTHYDPAVSAHCVSYVTMLYYIQHHPTDEISDDQYQKYLDKAFENGQKVLSRRCSDYVSSAKVLSGIVDDNRLALHYFEEESKKLRSAIYSKKISKTGEGEVESDYIEWEDLNLTNHEFESDPKKSTYQIEDQYDNIGMSYRCLSAGFFGLKQIREKIKTGKISTNAFNEVLIDIMAQGGDADTNGTVVGSLCGSLVGFQEISEKLFTDLGTEREKIILQEISSISQAKIREQEVQVEEASPSITIKPYFSQKFTYQNQGYDNFWFDKKERGLDFKVPKEKQNEYEKKIFNKNKFELKLVYQKMAKNLESAREDCGLNEAEVMLAIKLARQYGGISTAKDQDNIKSDIQSYLENIRRVETIQDNEIESLKNKLAGFSAKFQKLNYDSGILSGREGGKQVGLRLTFISDAVLSHFSVSQSIGR
jgi:ADP-ribosylglycohydrolase